MVGGVATITQGGQICRFIDSTGSPRDKVVDVSFTPGTHLTARPAYVAVTGKNNMADLVPLLILLPH